MSVQYRSACLDCKTAEHQAAMSESQYCKLSVGKELSHDKLWQLHMLGLCAIETCLIFTQSPALAMGACDQQLSGGSGFA